VLNFDLGALEMLLPCTRDLAAARGAPTRTSVHVLTNTSFGALAGAACRCTPPRRRCALPAGHARARCSPVRAPGPALALAVRTPAGWWPQARASRLVATGARLGVHLHKHQTWSVLVHPRPWLTCHVRGSTPLQAIEAAMSTELL
jgi:hypothetical protein